MKEFLLNLYHYQIFFYVTLIVIGTIVLTSMSFINIQKYKWRFTKKEDKLLKDSPFAPGISVIAPAYNEEKTIVANVNSMLTLDYPLFEVVIVNDGSKDRTLDLLIEQYELVETPFAYIEKIKTKPFKRIFKSTNPKYARLTVVDKENGGTKADASNAGINASIYPYFVCTDVDCILSRDALLKMIQPVLNSTVQVIAVGATMRMANSCEVDKGGVITRVRPPRRIIPCFQETEYLRAYLVSKMGWSLINAVPNVSGGLGLFDKSVVIEAGGYDPISHAEDMDMILRMIAYMRDFNKEYKIAYIPVTTCWTEGPPSISVLNKQRTRWARGLMQIFIVHRKFLFNRKYGRTGFLTMPYIFLFEFLAPVIEGVGLLILMYFLLTKQVNFETALLLLGYVYLLGVTVSTLAIVFDLTVKKLYKRFREYLKLFGLSLVEFILYHPLIVFFSLKGYVDFLSRQNFEWGAMKRQGFDQKQNTSQTDDTTN
ncbi:glycosyltransferase family 2 protein [Dysgonomonas sp. 216]|uniref:glycosyltransferase family 2 protein n=1 Tax=Dysgonomonas sp. 216 TaxID=2302934 RepID=UPI0013D24F70|nr:glycosyltransferase [Dysgonomonas sp. 216]NDW18487.1 glycosyltransferase family 2 protein [Dysgonomonas sp. 216]